MSDAQPNPAKASLTVKVGVVLTVLYLSGIGAHMFLARDGLTELSDLTLNAMGDFLSGIFAPLAFLWLVIAVFVQKDELNAQLEEFSRSVAQSERQAENLERQFLLSERAAQKHDMMGKFTLIAAECEVAIALFPSLAESDTSLANSEASEQKIKAFTKALQKFNDDQGGLASEWDSIPDLIEDNRDGITHHLQKIIAEIDLILTWLKLNQDTEVEAKVVASSLRQLRTNADVIIQHLDD